MVVVALMIGELDYMRELNRISRGIVERAVEEVRATDATLICESLPMTEHALTLGLDPSGHKPGLNPPAHIVGTQAGAEAPAYSVGAHAGAEAPAYSVGAQAGAEPPAYIVGAQAGAEPPGLHRRGTSRG